MPSILQNARNKSHKNKMHYRCPKGVNLYIRGLQNKLILNVMGYKVNKVLWKHMRKQFSLRKGVKKGATSEPN